MVRNCNEKDEMGQSHTYPEFFKPYMPQTSAQRLLIPTAFIASLDKVVPDKAILRNRLGRLWQVKVVETDNGVYFQKGWENFVKNYSLELGDFMVFRYNGDSIFYAKIFGTSGCEKKETMALASIERSIYFIKKEEEDEDQEETKACGEGCRKKGRNEETQPVKAENCNERDVEKYVDPKNGYFVTSLRDRNKSILYVPTDVVRDFNIQLQSGMEIILRVRNGRDWRGEVIKWKDGRVWIKRWANFCKWNGVTKDDKCICEFITMNLIQVHIVRA